MDRRILEQHLALATKHVATGERAIERQRAVIAELARDGHDAQEARRLLRAFEETQELHIADRDRLIAALAAGPKVPRE